MLKNERLGRVPDNGPSLPTAAVESVCAAQDVQMKQPNLTEEELASLRGIREIASKIVKWVIDKLNSGK